LAALFFTPLPARSSLCVLEALRWVVGGATMTTPGGTRTPCQSVPATPPCSAHRLLSWAGAPWLTGLRSFALPHPKHLSTLSASSAVRVHKTRRYGPPSRAVLALSGRGYAELRLNGVLRSSAIRRSPKWSFLWSRGRRFRRTARDYAPFIRGSGSILRASSVGQPPYRVHGLSHRS
jgi:hypothetical protein